MTDELEEGVVRVDGVNQYVGRISKLARACSACEWSAIEKPDRVCRLNPPQVTFLATPGMVMTPKGPQHGMEVKPWCAYPIVRDDAWCSRYQGRGAPVMARVPLRPLEQNDG